MFSSRRHSKSTPFDLYTLLYQVFHPSSKSLCVFKILWTWLLKEFESSSLFLLSDWKWRFDLWFLYRLHIACVTKVILLFFLNRISIVLNIFFISYLRVDKISQMSHYFERTFLLLKFSKLQFLVDVVRNWFHSCL